MAKPLKIATKGTGIPLVFLHGWGLNSGVWQPCIEQLQHDYEVITIDLPGFGLNVDHPLEPYTLANIAALIQQCISQPAVIIGWSLGGLLATELALSYPDKVKGLITVASSPCFVEQENWPGIKASVLSLFHRQLAQDTRKTIENFLKIQAMGSPHIRQDIKKIRDLVMQYPMPSKSTLDKSLAFLETTDQRAQMDKISQPFLRLYGKQDSLVPKEVIKHIDVLVERSESVLINNASHAPFISDVELFNMTIKDWLQKNFNK